MYLKNILLSTYTNTKVCTYIYIHKRINTFSRLEIRLSNSASLLKLSKTADNSFLFLPINIHNNNDNKYNNSSNMTVVLVVTELQYSS